MLLKRWLSPAFAGLLGSVLGACSGAAPAKNPDAGPVA
jgi:hypothetical protein